MKIFRPTGVGSVPMVDCPTSLSTYPTQSYFGSRPCVGQILTKGAFATIDLADNDTRNTTGFCVLFYPVCNLLPFPWDIDSAHYSLSNFMSLTLRFRVLAVHPIIYFCRKGKGTRFSIFFVAFQIVLPSQKATALIATSPCFT